MDKKIIAEETKRLVDKIEELHDESFKGYKIVPLLDSLEGLLIDNLSDSDDESILYAFHGYKFIAIEYRRMGRSSIAAVYDKKALEFARRLIKEFGFYHIDDEVKTLYEDTLRDRNYYIDDDCLDIKELVNGLIDDEIIENNYKARMNRRRTFKNDPVEMSNEYLAIVDKVDEYIDKNLKFRGMGSVHEAWSLKKEYLESKGIKWTSPAILNPHARFD